MFTLNTIQMEFVAGLWVESVLRVIIVREQHNRTRVLELVLENDKRLACQHD